MRILCKEKDYYDYIGYKDGYGGDDITFDRRDMEMIEPGQNYNGRGIENLVSSITDGCPQGAVVGVWIGFNLYIFRIWADPNRWTRNVMGTFLKSGFDWNAELLATRKEYNVTHQNPIEFVYIKTNLFELDNWKLNSWKDWKNYNASKKNEEFILNEYKTGNIANWKFKNVWGDGWLGNKAYKVPILKNTWIPKYVPAWDAYYAIEEWLIAQHNDVDQESEGLTDVDKAVNHGFDKKISFRNVK